MRPFRFWRDALFLLGVAAYATNRWAIKPHVANTFLRSYFNDLWLIPCALPLLLHVHLKLGWRNEGPPRWTEIAGHLVLWSLLFEWIGPKFWPRAIGDGWDVVCYWAGGLVAWLWWNRRTLFNGEETAG